MNQVSGSGPAISRRSSCHSRGQLKHSDIIAEKIESFRPVQLHLIHFLLAFFLALWRAFGDVNSVPRCVFSALPWQSVNPDTEMNFFYLFSRVPPIKVYVWPRVWSLKCRQCLLNYMFVGNEAYVLDMPFILHILTYLSKGWTDAQ